MDQPTVTLNVLWTPLAVCRLGAGARVPETAWDGEICSMVREHDAVSLICDEAQLPLEYTDAERDWRAIRLEAFDEMSAIEARATVARILRAAAVKSLQLEDDVLLVKAHRVHDAVSALERAGFFVEV